MGSIFFTKDEGTILDKKLLEILEDLKLSSDERKSYINDAVAIRDYMIGRLNGINDFQRYFQGATTLGSFLNDFDVDKPDEFDIHLKLKLPCDIKVFEGKNPPGSLDLQCIPNAKNYPNTPFNCGPMIYRKNVQNWMREIFETIFKHKELTLTLSNGRVYRVEYSKHLRGYAVAHTLYAVDEKDQMRRITFDFLPCFEFGRAAWMSDKQYPVSMGQEHSWFAVPYPKSRATSFMICAPQIERELLTKHPVNSNLKSALRLMKAIRDSNEMPFLKNYLIKNVFLLENERHKDCNHQFWRQPIGELLIYFTECLLANLRTGHILFFFRMEVNLLNRLDGMEVLDYKRKLKIILAKLRNCRKEKASNQDIARIFGV